MNQAAKKCGCGLSYSRETWTRLALVGTQYVPADAFGPAEAIELRNCACGSTLAIEVDVQAVTLRAPSADMVIAHFLGGEVLS